MDPTLVAGMISAMVLQKNRALPSPKRRKDGMRLRLQALAIAIVVASRLKGVSTD